MTERGQSQIQPFKIRPLQKNKGVTLFDKHCKTSAIRESLDIESLLLRIKRSQL